MNKEEFSKQVKKHHKSFLGTCCNLTKSKTKGKDLLQDALIKAFLAKSQFIEGSSFGKWVYKIIINTNIDNIRKKQ